MALGNLANAPLQYVNNSTQPTTITGKVTLVVTDNGLVPDIRAANPGVIDAGFKAT